MTNGFGDDGEVEPFIFENPNDPDGVHGLKPVSWNVVVNPDGTVEKITDLTDPRLSVMYFAAEQVQDDIDLITRKTAKYVTTFETSNRRQRRQQSQKAEMETRWKMSGSMALISTMQRGWRGPRFAILPTAVTPNGKPHPLRGQTAPCHPDWIGKLNGVEIREIELFLQDLYEPEAPNYMEDPDAETSEDAEVVGFRGSGPYLARPTESGQAV